MDKLNLNLLTEQVYITGQVNRIYEGILREDQSVDSNDDSIIKKVLGDLGISTGFIFQFGTGIGAFMRPVTQLLHNEGFNLNKEEVALLIVTAFAIMLTHSKVEIGKLTEAVKDKNLHIHLGSVSKFILSVKKLMSAIGEKIGRAVYTLSDVLGFTFMLVPTMEILSDVILNYGTTSDNIGQLMAGLLLAASSYGVKNVVGKLIDKFTRK
jgi:hypothetical protein